MYSPGWATCLALALAVLFVAPVRPAHPECASAPTPSAKLVCEQLHKWDDAARESSSKKKTVSLPPGFAGKLAPDLAPLVTSLESCTDIACVCFYLTGNRANTCTHQGKPVTKLVRKEYRMMTDDERNRFHAALNTMKQNGKYSQIARLHSQTGSSSPAHTGPAFLGWHREFIKRVEFELRRIDPTIYLPYWDSVMDGFLPRSQDSVMWSPELMGGSDGQGLVVTGPFAGWATLEGRANIKRAVGAQGQTFQPSDINFIMQQTEIDQVLAFSAPKPGCPFRADYNCLEYTHGNIHIYVGGDMFDQATSANDPIFFLHHSMVDLIWEMWRQSRQTRAQREQDYPPDNQLCSGGYHFGASRLAPFSVYRNIDALSNKYTDELYSFAPRPSCTAQNPSCGSKFLFCDLSHGQPRCAAKARVGGMCSGFTRGEDVCYNGVCQRNVCVQSAVTTPTPIPVVTKPPPKTPPPAQVQVDCYNEHQCCATWTQRGECQKNSGYMRDFCKASCNVCKPSKPLLDDCSDRHNNCAGWSRGGECQKNEAWMTENCRRSCSKCTTTRAQACSAGKGTATTKPQAQCENSDGCYNEFACCPHWSNQGLCRTNQEFMGCNCRVSCGMCFPSDYNYGACEDYHRSCATWSRSGECKKNPWMEENCRKSCNTCMSQRELRSVCGTTAQAGLVAPRRSNVAARPPQGGWGRGFGWGSGGAGWGNGGAAWGGWGK